MSLSASARRACAAASAASAAADDDGPAGTAAADASSAAASTAEGRRRAPILPGVFGVFGVLGALGRACGPGEPARRTAAPGDGLRGEWRPGVDSGEPVSERARGEPRPVADRAVTPGDEHIDRAVGRPGDEHDVRDDSRPGAPRVGSAPRRETLAAGDFGGRPPLLVLRDSAGLVGVEAEAGAAAEAAEAGDESGERERGGFSRPKREAARPSARAAAGSGVSGEAVLSPPDGGVADGAPGDEPASELVSGDVSTGGGCGSGGEPGPSLGRGLEGLRGTGMRERAVSAAAAGESGMPEAAAARRARASWTSEFVASTSAIPGRWDGSICSSEATRWCAFGE